MSDCPARGLYAYARATTLTPGATVSTCRGLAERAQHAQRDLFEQILLDTALRTDAWRPLNKCWSGGACRIPTAVPVNAALATVYARLGLQELEGGARARAVFTRARHPSETDAEISMPKTRRKSIRGQIDRAPRELVKLTARLDSLSHRESAREAYRPCANHRRPPAPRGRRGLCARAAAGEMNTSAHSCHRPGGRESGAPGPCVHFNSHIEWCKAAEGGVDSRTRSPRVGKDGRVYAGACT